jgi:ribosome-associated protein
VPESNSDINSNHLSIKPGLKIAPESVSIRQIRATGAGGQNVNKVSSAVHLRFDIEVSALPEPIKNRLKAIRDRRILANGTVLIKSQQHRTYVRNREAAFERLRELILQAVTVPARRIPTRPKKAAVRKRLDAKSRHSQLKRGRRPVSDDE